MNLKGFNKVDLYKLIIMASTSILEDIELMTADNIENIEVNIKDKEDLIHRIMSEISKHNAKKYDTEPVSYCTGCLSLKIKRLERTNTYYCGVCGNTNLEEATINEWEEKYKTRHGEEYIIRDK